MAHATGNPGHVPVPITADLSGLPENDRAVLALLRKAVEIMNGPYLKQMRVSSMASDATFTKPGLPFFYPSDAIRDELTIFMDEHPGSREELLSPFTEVVRSAGGFAAIPYSEMYETAFAQIGALLLEAATLVTGPHMRDFLEKRAEAFRTNQYRESDIAWIHANDSFFELTIGPYESYSDTLFGVKRTFEAILGIIRKDDTKEAAMYQEQIQRFDETLGKQYGYESVPTLTPMLVIDEVCAAGESLYEYVPMAYNLPNDPDIHKEVGSKKVFIKNVMDAKMRIITEPIGERVLDPRFLSSLDTDAALFFVIGHEASHGLSFRFNGDDFGPEHSSIEECKADVFGILFLYFLADQDKFDRTLLDSAVITHVIDCIRQVRFELHEAHGAGALAQINWLISQGALTIYDGRFWFSPMHFHNSFQSLGDAIYALSQTKSEQAAEQFISAWGTVPEGLEAIVASLADIPTDIDPQFSL